MGSSDFVAFAGAPSANVQDLAEYLADAQTSTGQISGIASSARNNRALRQGTFPAAAISQYMADVLNSSVADDGVVGNYLVQFWSALMCGSYFVDTGVSNQYQTTNPFGLVFPVPPPGLTVHLKIQNTNSGSATFNWMGTGPIAIKTADGKDVPPHTLLTNSVVALTYDGSNWQLPTAVLPGISILTSAADFYVATTGNDTTGQGTVASPWATLQKAYDYITDNFLNFGGYTITIHLADGTYSAGLYADAPPFGGGVVVIQGHAGNPAAVTINVNGDNAISATGNAILWVKDMTLVATQAGAAGGDAIACSAGGKVYFSNVVFGACSLAQIYTEFGGIAWAQSNYQISGGAAQHMNASASGSILISGTTVPITVTFNGNPAFGTFAFSSQGTIFAPNNTFTADGGVTGIRYNAAANGIIYSGGHGASYFPGSIAGSISTGGQYL